VQIPTHNFIEILSLDFGVWLKREVGVVSGFSLFVQKQRVAKTTLFQKGKHLASLTPFFRLNHFFVPSCSLFVPSRISNSRNARIYWVFLAGEEGIEPLMKMRKPLYLLMFQHLPFVPFVLSGTN